MLIQPLVWNTDTTLRVTSLTARLRGYAGIGEWVAGLSAGDLWGHESAYVLDAHYRALAGETLTFEASVRGARLAFEIEPLVDARGTIAGVTGRATELARTAFDTGIRHRAVLVIGLDDFPSILERGGRVFGEHVLAAVMKRLERHTRASDTVTRIGGDQFALWIDGVSTANAVFDTAHKVLRGFDEALILPGAALTMSASIGVATSQGDDHVSEAALLAAAFQEMREVKRNGGNGIKLATSWQVPSSPAQPAYVTQESA